jgi:hypothetical protein
MPKSKVQLHYINAAAARWEVPQSVANEFNAAAKGKKLPERAKKKAKGKKR